MPPLIAWLGVALGSALGGVARHLCTLATAGLGGGLPAGTIAINLVGSAVIGFAATGTGPGARLAAPEPFRLFLMVGICGGFTTFSAFSLQTLDLLRQGAIGPALANVGLSLALCLAAVVAGHAAARRLDRRG